MAHQPLVIVTGASRGLGEALARDWLVRGARVVALARRITAPADDARPGPGMTGTTDNAAPGRRPTDAAVDRAAGCFIPVQSDLSTTEGAAFAATQVRTHIEQWLATQDAAGIDGEPPRCILINNAGSVDPINVAAGLQDPSAITRAFALNVTAALTLTATVVAALGDSPVRCQVLNISSGAGRNPSPGWSVYCATKAALDMATRVLNVEQAASGRLRAVALAPGVVDTGMQENMRGHDTTRFPVIERFRTLHAEGKLASPDAVAAAIGHYLNRDDFGATEIDDIRNYH